MNERVNYSESSTILSRSTFSEDRNDQKLKLSQTLQRRFPQELRPSQREYQLKIVLLIERLRKEVNRPGNEKP